MFISSNHAADYYEQVIWTDRMEFVTPDMLPLSDNYYGWAKAAYELPGFAFATGGVNGGRKLEVVQLRIGGPQEIDIDACGSNRCGLGSTPSLRSSSRLARRWTT